MADIRKIKKTIEDFTQSESDFNPVFAQSRHDIVNLIDKYWVNRYANSDFTSTGDKKVFYNVIINPVIVAAKQTDIDTKDIKVIPELPSTLTAAEFMRKELNVWMKDNEFSKLLNDITFLRPKYGSVVVKRTFDSNNKLRIKPVKLQNLFLQDNVENIEDSFFVAEVHEFSPNELRRMPWEESAIEEAIALAAAEIKDNGVIKVYEFLQETEGNKDNYFIVAEVARDKGILLWSDKKKITELYKDLHWDKLPHRWQGRGQVELSFEEQIHLNRIENLKAAGLHWNSKYLFQTSDEGINRNLLTETENGQILKVRDEIGRVPVEERNLAAYSEAQNRWEFNLQRKTFATDLIRGQRPPSGTPLGTSLLASQQAGNFFDLKREEAAIFIKELTYDWIIPQFKKDNRFEHTIMLEGIDEQQQQIFDDLILQEKVQKKASNHLARQNAFPDPITLQLYKEQSKQELQDPKAREKTIPDNFYDKIKFKLDIVISGESTDVQGKINAITIALQNTQDPQERRQLINMLMAVSGQPPLFDVARDSISTADVAGEVQAQGSAPRPPQAPNRPTPGQAQTVV